jgi:hypothetical protein
LFLPTYLCFGSKGFGSVAENRPYIIEASHLALGALSKIAVKVWSFNDQTWSVQYLGHPRLFVKNKNGM